MNDEPREAVLWALGNARLWRDELAAHFLVAPGEGSRSLLARLDDLSSDLARGLDNSGDPGELLAQFKQALQSTFFLRDTTSTVIGALGPALAGHIRTRMGLALSRLDQGGDFGDPVPLGDESFLAGVATRLRTLLPKAEDAVASAPWLEEDEKSALRLTLEELEREPSADADAREILGAEYRLRTLVDELASLVRQRHDALLADLEPRTRAAERRWREIEDVSWRFNESPLSGGRGCGTVGLAWLVLSLAAIFVRQQTARLIFFGIIILGGVVWSLINLVGGSSIRRRYLAAAKEAKDLAGDLAMARNQFLASNTKIANLKNRLRGEIAPSPEGSTSR